MRKPPLTRKLLDDIRSVARMMQAALDEGQAWDDTLTQANRVERWAISRLAAYTKKEPK